MSMVSHASPVQPRSHWHLTLPRGATDRELLAALGPGSAHDDTAVPPFEDSP